MCSSFDADSGFNMFETQAILLRAGRLRDIRPGDIELSNLRRRRKSGPDDQHLTVL